MQDKGPNFSTWGPYAIAGSFQGVLLLLCLYFTYVNPSNGLTSGPVALDSQEGSKAALNPTETDPYFARPSQDSTASLVDSDSQHSLQTPGPLLQPIETATAASGRSRPQSPARLRSPHREVDSTKDLVLQMQ